MSELLKYAIIVLIPFMVQLVILFTTKKRFQPLRFALPVLAGAACIIAILLSFLSISESFNVPFLEDIGVLLGPLFTLMAIIICLVLGSLALMGWGLAWPVYYLINLIKRKAFHKTP